MSGGFTDEQDAERARDREALRNAAAAQTFGSRALRDGTWFVRLVKSHAKAHQATHDPSHWDRLWPGLDAEARAKKLIGRVALHAATAGAVASVGASTGELLSLFTEGLAAPVGVPAAVLSMLIEAAYTARLQIDLMCDLASIYGVPFDADDLGELATLFAVALGLDLSAETKDDDGADDEPKGMVARLIELEEGQIGTRIGRKLIEESVMRNVVPFVGIGISARWNYVGTRKLGAAVKKYIRYRHAIQGAIRALKVDGIGDGAILVEGAWLLATVDGVASHEEMLAISLLVDALPAAQRCKLDATLSDDEEGWFERLPQVPAAARGQLLDALYLLAGTDKVLQPAERRFLRRVGKVLGCAIDFPRIEQICRHLARGDELPEAIAAPGSSLGERLSR